MQASPLSPAAKRSTGFTLIELLVVIMPSSPSWRSFYSLSMFRAIENRAEKDSGHQRHAQHQGTAIVSYYTDYHKYPISNDAADGKGAASDGGNNDTVLRRS